MLAPKVEGTWILDKLTDTDELDFFVLFSSSTTLAGIVGQGDYTAANAYLDSYAAYRNKKGRKSLTIKWSAWKETGMAFNYGVNSDGFFKVLPTQKAIYAFGQVLNRDIERVFIGEINFRNQSFDQQKFPFIKLSKEIISKFVDDKEQLAQVQVNKDEVQKNTNADLNPNKETDILIAGEANQNYTSTEISLAYVYSEVLGLKEVNIYDDFYDLGGDSIIAMKIINTINKKLNIKSDVIDLFDNTTVKEFAKYIDDEYLVKISSNNKAEEDAILPVPKAEYYSASAAQSRLYILNQFDIGSTAYNITKVMKIIGNIDIKRFETAFKKLIERHEILRTSFSVVDQNLVQKVHDSIDFNISEVDLYSKDENGYVSYEDIKENIDAFIRPFDLGTLPLLRVGLIRISMEEYLMIFDIHHIISDGTSIGILTKELTDLYRGMDIPELKVQYKDFSIWQNDFFNTEALKKQEKYWLEIFKNGIPALNLPTDYYRPLVQSFCGDKVDFKLDRTLFDNLNKRSAEAGTTLFMYMISAFNVLLHKYTGQEDIIIGSPVEGRKHKDLDNLAGMFVNTLALRNYPKADKTFEQLLKEVKENSLNAYANQDYQFDKLVDVLDIERDMSRNPLFDIMFDFQTVKSTEVEMAGLRLIPYEYGKMTTNFDIVLHIIASNDALSCSFEFCTELFRKETVARMAKHYLNILDVIVSQPEIKLSDIEMILEEEKQLILGNFNDTGTEYPADKTIHQIFEEECRKAPNNIALVCGNRQLTYGELSKKSNQLAKVLRIKGVVRESIVGIMAESSIEMAIGIIGILKAGGAYLPIDPDYPADRIGYMIGDSGANIMLVQNHLQDRFGFKGEILDLDALDSYSEDHISIDNVNTPDDLAYIIYTSGSTGKPKGVMVEHKNVIRLVKNTNYIEFKQNDRILKTGALVFDASTFEIWGALLNGLRLYLVDESTIIDPIKLESALKEYQITTLWLTSPLFNQLSQQRIELFSSLKNLLVGGDVLSPKHINRVREMYKDLRIINGYGPTENTTFSVCFEINDSYEQNIPIGKPISNSTAYILDKNRKLQPIGVEGELCVGGDGVGRGYINQQERTQEKFVSDPFLKGGRMYLTGDSARWLPDGNIEFLGRKDNQVKIRGFRIEIGEIEEQILRHKLIKEAMVTSNKDLSDIKYLIAYFVADEELKVNEIREFLCAKLPDYMIPSYFIQLDRLPLTINGKIDHKSLPKPEVNINKAALYDAPANDTEIKLVGIWQEILGVDGIGTNDNFFEMGGHSLRAAILISRIRKEINAEISLKDVFANPTVKGLADQIKRSEREVFEVIECAEKMDFYPLSPAQKRMYVLNRLEGKGTVYNVPGMVILDGSIDRVRFENTFRKLAQRHESFRTSFEIIAGEPVQRIHENVEFNIEYFELLEELVTEKIRELIKPFDLSKAPLLRAVLIKVREDRHIMLLDMHHIISDGTSLNIIIREFSEIYNGKELPQLRIQYKDYTMWQKKLAEEGVLKEQEEYWMERFKGEIPVLDLPTDRVRGAVQSFEGSNFEFEISGDLRERINILTKETGTTLYMVLLALYNTFLMKYTGQEDIIVGSPVAGRPHADLLNIVGMFVNTLAMRNYPGKDKTFIEFLYEVKENSLKAFENQEYPLEDLVEKLDLRRDMSRNPLFDVMLILQNMDSENLEVQGLVMKPYKADTGISKFDLAFNVEEKKDSILFCIEYASELFNKDTIARMSLHYIKILEEVLKNPERKLSDLEMITDYEKKLICEFNNTEAVYSKDKTIQQLFEEQVENTPDNLAVICEDEQLTYRELNERANQLAGILRKKGVKRESIIAIMAEPSLHMVAGIMGILKAGGAYLPIDPEYPEDRIKYMLEDSKTELLLKYGGQNKEIKFMGEIIDLDDEAICKEAVENPKSVNTPNDLAYVIYTSGSTGKPKGVMIEHRGLVNFVQWRHNAYNYSSGDVSLQMLSFSFDGFGTNLYPALLAGGSVVIPNNIHKMNFTHIKGLIKQRKVTNMSIVPSMYGAILESSQAEDLNSIRFIVLAGEKCDKWLVEKSFSISPNIRLINEYGPTENTITTTALVGMKSDCEAIIGTPISNNKVYILDADGKGQLLPIGIVGELCISGDSLSRGYLNQPELTAQKFKENPFETGEKIYHTGDLAKWRPDGNIEFIGRMDNQVKLRGYRIELGEIEKLLLQHSKVKEAVVIVRGDNGGDKCLCAYIAAQEEIDQNSIRTQLLEELPEYMIPSCFVVLTKIPITPNGKVDIKALPEPVKSKDKAMEYEALGNELEQKIVSIWSEVLGTPNIGINDNFFELGGHSLKAAVMLSKIHKEMNIEMPLKEFFVRPTVKSQASFIKEASKSIFTSIEPTPKKDFYPLSSAQKRMLIQAQIQGDGTAYNSPGAVIIEGKIDKVQFENALKMLLERHETLRTSFEMIDMEGVQRVHEKVEFNVEYYKWQEEDIDEKIKTLVRPFDLSKAPLFRVVLVELKEDRHMMMYDMHHIISDGVSMDILTGEFFALYAGKELPQLRIQYRDYTLWQERLFREGVLKKQEDYWMETYRGEIPELDLPTDYKRPDVMNYRGSRIYFKMGTELYKKIRSFAIETETTLYMLLLSAYNLLLSKYTGKEDVIVASPIAGRQHADLENIIGMFVNMLPMRNFPKEQMKFIDFIDSVKGNCLKAYENQDYQLEMLIEKLLEIGSLNRNSNRNPLFDVVFAMQNTVSNFVEVEGLKFYQKELEFGSVKFDILIDAYEENEDIRFVLEYSTDLFKRSTAERITQNFIEILEQAVNNKDMQLKDFTISNNILIASDTEENTVDFTF